jgi:hypothetical protein
MIFDHFVGDIGSGCHLASRFHMPFDNPPQAPIGDVAILMDARSRIADPSRWLQYGFQNGDRHCLVAALSLASGSPSFDIPNETERRLAKHLAKQMSLGRDISRWVTFVSPRHGLMMFNDRPRTRHDDVMGLFDRAIDHVARKALVGVGLR